MLPAKSTLLDEVLHNVFLLLCNGQGQTCVTTMAHSKLLLSKYWNEELHQFQVAMVSSNVQGIPTILLTQDGNTYISTLQKLTTHTHHNSTHTHVATYM